MGMTACFVVLGFAKVSACTLCKTAKKSGVAGKATPKHTHIKRKGKKDPTVEYPNPTIPAVPFMSFPSDECNYMQFHISGFDTGQDSPYWRKQRVCGAAEDKQRPSENTFSDGLFTFKRGLFAQTQAGNQLASLDRKSVV